jgi:hypothetical protein
MTKLGWIIDRDHLADASARAPSNANAVGMRGPYDYEGDGSELTLAFQMKDDDGILYYEGRMHEDCEGFEPLDDFGMPNAGCTSIWLKNAKSEWEMI